MYKTINRGWLKKQINAGKVEAKCEYHYTDDYAFDNAYGFGTMKEFVPARIRHPKFEQRPDVTFPLDYCVDDDRKEGFVNFDECDFTTKSGAAYKTEESDNITLRIHSNEVWELRIVK